MTYIASKTGAGAFHLIVQDDGKTFVSTGEKHNTVEDWFDTPQAAYDHHRESAHIGGYGSWNVCYHLEDVIDGNIVPTIEETKTL